jgi:hypothetical protein
MTPTGEDTQFLLFSFTGFNPAEVFSAIGPDPDGDPGPASIAVLGLLGTGITVTFADQTVFQGVFVDDPTADAGLTVEKFQLRSPNPPPSHCSASPAWPDAADGSGRRKRNPYLEVSRGRSDAALAVYADSLSSERVQSSSSTSKPIIFASWLRSFHSVSPRSWSTATCFAIARSLVRPMPKLVSPPMRPPTASSPPPARRGSP